MYQISGFFPKKHILIFNIETFKSTLQIYNEEYFNFIVTKLLKHLEENPKCFQLSINDKLVPIKNALKFCTFLECTTALTISGMKKYKNWKPTFEDKFKGFCRLIGNLNCYVYFEATEQFINEIVFLKVKEPEKESKKTEWKYIENAYNEAPFKFVLYSNCLIISVLHDYMYQPEYENFYLPSSYTKLLDFLNISYKISKKKFNIEQVKKAEIGISKFNWSPRLCVYCKWITGLYIGLFYKWIAHKTTKTVEETPENLNKIELLYTVINDEEEMLKILS